MRTTLFKLLQGLKRAARFPEPVYEFGAYRVRGQARRGSVRDYFAWKEFIGCDGRAGRRSIASKIFTS
jgi:hypothetical protein